MNNVRYFYLVLTLLVAVACSEKQTKTKISTGKDKEFEVITVDTSFLVDNVKIRLQLNQLSEGKDLILLPGWNFPNEHWMDSTHISEFAKESGYNLVMVEMGKSIYQKTIYPSTRGDWRKEKTITWLGDTLIPQLQKDFSILTKDRDVSVVGISTGGRGAIALLVYKPDLIDHSIALSGDYSTLTFPNDNLYRGFFGESELNKEIWESEDLTENLTSLKADITLVHGKLDRIVTPQHSRYLYVKMKEREMNVSLVEYSDQEHNYVFWSHVIDSLFSLH